MRHRVVIVDYDVGNVQSVAHALNFLGYTTAISRDKEIICGADAFVLPGVGAFSEATLNMERFQLVQLLNREVLEHKKPLLGICLGMQILGNSSQESPGHRGLGWIDFDVVAIPPGGSHKIPHVGWNTIQAKGADYLFHNLGEKPHFYFDHSFYADAPERFIAARCDYGRPLAAIVASENVVGVQFHPEKSQNNGLKLFRNFFDHFGVEHC